MAAITAMLIAGLLLSAQAQAQSEGDVSPTASDYAAQAFDVVVLRPLGLAAVIIGAGLFVPAAIVTAPGGRDAVQEAWEVFIQAPARFAFRRPLGEF